MDVNMLGERLDGIIKDFMLECDFFNDPAHPMTNTDVLHMFEMTGATFRRFRDEIVEFEKSAK